MARLRFLIFPKLRPSQPDQELLQLGSKVVPLRFIRNESARRYILRVGDDGSARITIPRRGSFKAAREFVERHRGWIEKQLHKIPRNPASPLAWTHGTEILFRGEKTPIQVEPDGERMHLGDQVVRMAQPAGNLRPILERHLWKLAAGELAPRTWELAGRNQLIIHRVTVRNQRSRWGSCSVKKTISLNWRLIQTPSFVSDYIILHELMHLREMNHSRRFWREVEQVCPEYSKAEGWLKDHEGAILGALSGG